MARAYAADSRSFSLRVARLLVAIVVLIALSSPSHRRDRENGRLHNRKRERLSSPILAVDAAFNRAECYAQLHTLFADPFNSEENRLKYSTLTKSETTVDGVVFSVAKFEWTALEGWQADCEKLKGRSVDAVVVSREQGNKIAITQQLKFCIPPASICDDLEINDVFYTYLTVKVNSLLPFQMIKLFTDPVYNNWVLAHAGPTPTVCTDLFNFYEKSVDGPNNPNKLNQYRSEPCVQAGSTKVCHNQWNTDSSAWTQLCLDSGGIVFQKMDNKTLSNGNKINAYDLPWCVPEPCLLLDITEKMHQEIVKTVQDPVKNVNYEYQKGNVTLPEVNVVVEIDSDAGSCTARMLDLNANVNSAKFSKNYLAPASEWQSNSETVDGITHTNITLKWTNMEGFRTLCEQNGGIILPRQQMGSTYGGNSAIVYWLGELDCLPHWRHGCLIDLFYDYLQRAAEQDKATYAPKYDYVRSKFELAEDSYHSLKLVSSVGLSCFYHLVNLTSDPTKSVNTASVLNKYGSEKVTLTKGRFSRSTWTWSNLGDLEQLCGAQGGKLVSYSETGFSNSTSGQNIKSIVNQRICVPNVCAGTHVDHQVAVFMQQQVDDGAMNNGFTYLKAKADPGSLYPFEEENSFPDHNGMCKFFDTLASDKNSIGVNHPDVLAQYMKLPKTPQVVGSLSVYKAEWAGSNLLDWVALCKSYNGSAYPLSYTLFQTDDLKKSYTNLFLCVAYDCSTEDLNELSSRMLDNLLQTTPNVIEGDVHIGSKTAESTNFFGDHQGNTCPGTLARLHNEIDLESPGNYKYRHLKCDTDNPDSCTIVWDKKDQYMKDCQAEGGKPLPLSFAGKRNDGTVHGQSGDLSCQPASCIDGTNPGTLRAYLRFLSRAMQNMYKLEEVTSTIGEFSFTRPEASCTETLKSFWDQGKPNNPDVIRKHNGVYDYQISPIGLRTNPQVKIVSELNFPTSADKGSWYSTCSDNAGFIGVHFISGTFWNSSVFGQAQLGCMPSVCDSSDTNMLLDDYLRDKVVSGNVAFGQFTVAGASGGSNIAGRTALSCNRQFNMMTYLGLNLNVNNKYRSEVSFENGCITNSYGDHICKAQYAAGGRESFRRDCAAMFGEAITARLSSIRFLDSGYLWDDIDDYMVCVPAVCMEASTGEGSTTVVLKHLSERFAAYYRYDVTDIIAVGASRTYAVDNYFDFTEPTCNHMLAQYGNNPIFPERSGLNSERGKSAFSSLECSDSGSTKTCTRKWFKDGSGKNFSQHCVSGSVLPLKTKVTGRDGSTTVIEGDQMCVPFLCFEQINWNDLLDFLQSTTEEQVGLYNASYAELSLSTFITVKSRCSDFFSGCPGASSGSLSSAQKALIGVFVPIGVLAIAAVLVYFFILKRRPANVGGSVDSKALRLGQDTTAAGSAI